MKKLYLVDVETLERLAEVTDEWVKEHLELWDMGLTIEVERKGLPDDCEYDILIVS